ncbi:MULTISPECIES: hypothetical protein [Clostridium]|jgi:hypothetical protein|uniref:Uncharacterized protein n=1 Tax=Clostridium butyricum TaxID=1492 RepID=A0A0A6Q054_CLOBU|nr:MULTISPECIES: hypothetical protein [Clostridium]ETI88657.1 MAG: hypothetical protein Q607_CBUC00195G0033 [Clostridium butyricum DORA_1]ALP91246.1 hypothetical protein ATN24_14210 [Clostridium butyricum]ALS17688.1 hypothetical protein ATD26_12640 [Clostridium butyricum]ANF14869.1 hypothetical protein AZ909_12665 [Clostridium butyricum]AOR94877.1 hypothetical protein BBB49_12550 [Clostridium butyricum]
MLTDTEERMLQYIQDHANANVRGKTFFRMTDVLEDAFLLTEDKAYEVFKNIMSRKNIGNSKYDIIDEYIDMLKKGYGSIKEQVDIFGGDRYSIVVSTAEKRIKSYEGGSFFDVLREVYNVSDSDLNELILKFISFASSPGFSIKLDEEMYNKFLQSDLEELDKQYERFLNLNNN